MIDGKPKTQKDAGHLLGMRPTYAGSLERQAMIRLGGGLSWNAQSYGDLIPAVIELGEKPV